MYIPVRIYRGMSRIVKLQKVGNSIRATIPKDVADNLSLSEGDEVIVDAKGRDIYHFTI